MNPVDGSPISHAEYVALMRERQVTENEELRHRVSLLEERVASLERRLAKLANV